MPPESFQRNTVSFPTKVDLWLILVLVVALGGSVVASLVAVDPESPGSWFPLLTMVGTIGLIGAFSLPTVYTLSDSEMVVRYGVFRRVIPYTAIERAQRSRNPLSSPAWSLDRIAIHYREGRSLRFVLISPVRRDEFMKLLMVKGRLKDSPRGLIPDSSPD